MDELTDLQKSIIIIVTEHWKEDFSGISALDISEKTGKTHKEILSEIEELKTLGLLNVNASVELELYPARFSTRGGTRFPGRKMVTSIVFPTKMILKEIFEKGNKDYGYYTNQLHLGDRQTGLRSFRREVLNKYFQQPEKYHLDDDVIGGWVATKDQYYFSLPDANREQNQEIIGQIEYGKRKLKDGDPAIAVILKDLSDLHPREQLYWASFEIDNPIFASEDKEYETFLRRDFGGQEVYYRDPLQRILELVQSINQICMNRFGVDFFRKTQNPRLKYPLFGNKTSYVEAHKELWKAVGSFKKDLLEKLIEVWSVLKPKNYSELREYGLFRLAFSELDGHRQERILEPFKTCNKARNKDAHAIVEAKIENVNYTLRFIWDCQKLVESLEEIKRCFE